VKNIEEREGQYRRNEENVLVTYHAKTCKFQPHKTTPSVSISSGKRNLCRLAFVVVLVHEGSTEIQEIQGCWEKVWKAWEEREKRRSRRENLECRGRTRSIVYRESFFLYIYRCYKRGNKL
jgi:hypothetical protein